MNELGMPFVCMCVKEENNIVMNRKIFLEVCADMLHVCSALNSQFNK